MTQFFIHQCPQSIINTEQTTRLIFIIVRGICLKISVVGHILKTLVQNNTFYSLCLALSELGAVKNQVQNFKLIFFVSNWMQLEDLEPCTGILCSNYNTN